MDSLRRTHQQAGQAGASLVLTQGLLAPEPLGTTQTPPHRPLWTSPAQVLQVRTSHCRPHLSQWYALDVPSECLDKIANVVTHYPAIAGNASMTAFANIEYPTSTQWNGKILGGYVRNSTWVQRDNARADFQLID